MLIYSAGQIPIEKLVKEYKLELPLPRLDSYYYLKSAKLIRDHKYYHKFFLDSGAHSAWTQGVSINLDAYIKFIKDHLDYLHVYAALDDIHDWRKSVKNTEYMEAAGLKPIAVFHVGEPWELLEDMVKKYDYIALGGNGKAPNAEALRLFMNEAWSRICDDKGVAKCKVHGFGMTRKDLMEKYPWYSVDSTSPILAAGMGRVVTDKWEVIDLSIVSGTPSLVDKMYIEQRGYDVIELTNDYILREKFNFESQRMWEKYLSDNVPKFTFEQISLL